MWIDLVPLWVWWVLGALILLFIYFQVSSETKKKVGYLFSKYWPLLFIILIYFLMRANLGTWSEDDWLGKQANTYGILLLSAYILGRLFLQRERYFSTHAVADNMSGSCALYFPCGDHVAMIIGSTDATGFPWPFGHATWIVPKRHFKKVNGKRNSPAQIYCKTQLFKSDINEIPPLCKELIEPDKRFDKENIFYGEFSHEEKLHINEEKKNSKDAKEKAKKSAEELELTIRDSNRMLNESRTMIKGKSSSIKGFVSDAEAIRKTAQGKSFLTRGGLSENDV